jgi:hypothetical protein
VPRRNPPLKGQSQQTKNLTVQFAETNVSNNTEMSHHYQNYSSNLGKYAPNPNQQHHPVKHHQHGHHGYHSRHEHRNDYETLRGSNSYDSRAGLTKNRSHDLRDDHSTATATTAAFTSHAGSHSYSMDEGSVASEYGTEVFMNRTPGSQGSYARFKSTTPYSAHTFKAGNHTFTVDSKYAFTRVIGSGAYGVVISAHDTQLNSKVAIKMVPRAFQDEIDAKRILREIKLLKHLKHENIVGIVDMMPPMYRYVDDFNDVYIVSELMETDLYRIIYSKQSLSIDHVQYLHRDLKPSNLLVNSNCDLKVCDFGLARGVFDRRNMWLREWKCCAT